MHAGNNWIGEFEVGDTGIRDIKLEIIKVQTEFKALELDEILSTQ